jgi:hypothetical protein
MRPCRGARLCYVWNEREIGEPVAQTPCIQIVRTRAQLCAWRSGFQEI